MKMTADNNNTTKTDDDTRADYYSSNSDKILEVRNRRLVTRDGKHKSNPWTYVEGAYSIDNNVTSYHIARRDPVNVLMTATKKKPKNRAKKR